mgnify:FL=1
MYKIYKGGTLFATIGSPVWVKMQENESYGLSDIENAQGIVVDGTVYHVEGLPDLEGVETVSVTQVDDGIYADNLIALLTDIDNLKNAEQFRKVVQMFAGSLSEEQAMEVSTVYPVWEPDHTYAVGDIFSYGTNSVGDPQLYKVVQAHTSQDNWKPGPDAFGLDDSGYPVWSQPSGVHDAYNTGDIVNYNGTLYRSLVDGNVWSPDAYPNAWEKVE